MKTIKNKEEIRRVTDKQADDLTKRGWKFCPKSEWKVTRPETKKSKKEETK